MKSWKEAPLLAVVGCSITMLVLPAAAFAQHQSPNLFFEPDATEIKLDYGPPACETRATLFQWSYGTSFSGGGGLNSPMATDRPDFTESSKTVGRGVTQLEFGYTYIHDNDSGSAKRIDSIGEPLLRVGVLFEWLELRIATNYIEESSRGPRGRRISNKGIDDLDLGLKLALTPQEGILPELAFIPHVIVPSGALGISGEKAAPGFNWIYAWDLSDCVTVAGSSQYQRVPDPDTNQAHNEFLQSVVIGYVITERIGGFAEWFAFMPFDAISALPEHYTNGGFTFAVNDNFQLDVRAGFGWNSAAADYFAGTGGVVRF